MIQRYSTIEPNIGDLCKINRQTRAHCFSLFSSSGDDDLHLSGTKIEICIKDELCILLQKQYFKYRARAGVKTNVCKVQLLTTTGKCGWTWVKDVDFFT